LGDPAFLQSPTIDSESNLDRLRTQALAPAYLFVQDNPISIFDSTGLYADCCCDVKTVSQNRKTLIDRYNKAVAYLARYRPPDPLPETNQWSCQGVSDMIGQFMSPAPHCWTCHKEDHWNKWPWWTFGRDDLNVIVCESHPLHGGPEKIVFDYWHNAPAAGAYSEFVNKYPYEHDPDIPYRYADCSKPEGDWPADNYAYLNSIIDPKGKYRTAPIFK
jgi:hypothetical protein